MQRYLQLFSLLLLLFAQLLPAAGRVEEGRVKAVVAYKITHFVVWPEKSGPLKLCTLGSSKLSDLMNNIVRQAGKTDKISVYRQSLNSNFKKRCDALYIRDLDETNVRSVLSSVKQWPVLTIGDSEAFARQGGMVGLYTENDKVRFAVNLRAVKQGGLLVKSQLLNLARIIQ